MQALSTIIVDDEDLARRGLALRLKQIPGIEIVAECSNGRQALQAIAEHEPDLLFLDIQMPGMDGLSPPMTPMPWTPSRCMPSTTY